MFIGITIESCDETFDELQKAKNEVENILTKFTGRIQVLGNEGNMTLSDCNGNKCGSVVWDFNKE